MTAARKAKTEMPGGDVTEVRTKSAMVELETQPKVASSEPSYEAIVQQIAYLMSTVTSQNTHTSGENGPRYNKRGGKFTNTRIQRPKKDRKDMLCWGCRGTGHGWRECLTPIGGNYLPFKPANQNLNGRWGRKHKPPVLSQPCLGRSQHQ